MTVKDELLLFWGVCFALILYCVRHFFGGATCLVQQIGAMSLAAIPHVLGFFLAHWH